MAASGPSQITHNGYYLLMNTDLLCEKRSAFQQFLQVVCHLVLIVTNGWTSLGFTVFEVTIFLYFVFISTRFCFHNQNFPDQFFSFTIIFHQLEVAISFSACGM